MGSRILLLEGRRASAFSCTSLLEKQGHTVVCTHTRRDALEQLHAEPPDLIIVDSRSLRFSASRFCQAVRENGNQVPMLLLALEDEDEDEPCAGVAAVLRGAFTSRKLLNRVKRCLSTTEGEVLRAGDVVLDVKRRTVTRHGQQHRLTPKQTCLLEVFMRNRGRVLTRAVLMREVWNTDFVGDTRTLEVHIHWLRKAIEDDPARPVYLTTVRRLGYRFDVP